MKNFNQEYFQKFIFTKEQLKTYFSSAQKNLKIAKESNIPEIIFKFSYDALIKTGITLIAYKGYKIRNRLGHHIKILEMMGEILRDKDIEVIGNMMRKERNIDLYNEGILLTQKQCKEYLQFVSDAIAKANKNLNG